MNKKIFVVIAFLLIVTGAVAKQCYECIACPRPFKGNEAGVTQITVADNEYCYKTVEPILQTEARGNGGSDCTPIDKLRFCCMGDLCNGATTSTLSVKLFAVVVSLFFAMQVLN